MLLNKISKSTKYVSENSEYVKINYAELNNFIMKFEYGDIAHYLKSNPFGIMDLSIETIINFLLIYHSIGFCFWGNPKWTIETDEGEIDGAYALMYILLKRFRKTDDLITEKELENILKSTVEIPLLKERCENIKQVNKIFKKQYNFYARIKDLRTDKELLNYIVKTFPFFKDEARYNGKITYFYKLAQLLVSDILHVREIKEKIEVDYSNLLGCADYKIPQVLRSLDILEFNNILSEIVDNGKSLKKYSDMEVEIRANMITVIDYIYNKLEGKIDRIHINDYIWSQGQDKDKINKLYHRTLTTHY